MAALVAAIHVFGRAHRKASMTGSRPAARPATTTEVASLTTRKARIAVQKTD
jgi:hypothetical protein